MKKVAPWAIFGQKPSLQHFISAQGTLDLGSVNTCRIQVLAEDLLTADAVLKAMKGMEWKCFVFEVFRRIDISVKIRNRKKDTLRVNAQKKCSSFS